MKQFIDEFKKFIARGNVIDLAVGILIGSAFGKVVTSLVEDIIMPPLGLLLGKVSFTELKYIIPNTDIAIRYGSFIQSVVDFLIIGFTIFLVVRVMNRFMKKKEVEQAEANQAEAEKAEAFKSVEKSEPTREAVLLEEIRDLLRVRR